MTAENGSTPLKWPNVKLAKLAGSHAPASLCLLLAPRQDKTKTIIKTKAVITDFDPNELLGAHRCTDTAH